jgi:hypothetical protein
MTGLHKIIHSLKASKVIFSCKVRMLSITSKNFRAPPEARMQRWLEDGNKKGRNKILV